MGTVADFLGSQVLEELVAGRRAFNPVAQPMSAEQEAKLAPLFKSAEFFNANKALIQRAHSTGYYRDWMELEQAAGSAVEVIRNIAKRAAEPWAVISQGFDFSTRTVESPGWTTPSRAKELIESNRGEIIERQGQHVRCRWLERPSPMLLEFHKALECAAISGDRELARAVAASYELERVDQLKTQFEIRPAMLRHLLAGEEPQANSLAKKLEKGYVADFPPDLIEFPLGALNKDASLLADGIRALTTKLNNQWNRKKWEKKHADLVARSKGRRRQPPGLNDFLRKVGRELVGLRWMSSSWAFAFLNVASWRGVGGLFEQETLFSDWFPLELCRS